MRPLCHCDGKCLDDCLVVQAVNGLDVGMVLMEPSGRIAWLNRVAEEILGTDGDDLTGRPIEQVLKDPQMSAFWQDAVGNGGIHHAEVSIQWPRPLELRLHATHCRDRNDTDIGRALLICDVTDERKVQVELSQAVATRLLDLTSGHMPPEPVANLTQQELRILRLVGRGLGNDEIAHQTNISASTVRSHLKSLYRKLSLSSRAEAVSYAVRHHLG